MIDALFACCVGAYGIASALLLLHLVGRGEAPSSGVRALVAAAALHVALDALFYGARGVTPLAGTAPALSFVALCAVLAYLAVQRARPRLAAIGAFVGPVAFVLLLGSRFAQGAGPRAGGTALFSVHIASSAVSLAALTLACAMSVAYLLLDREMKARRLGGLFRRLPPLEVLDGLTHRFVLVGLPALTAGVLTGHLVAVQLRGARGAQWQQYFALTAWCLFALVLLLRAVAGWRGRRMALGTVAGYASALLVLVVYAARAGAR